MPNYPLRVNALRVQQPFGEFYIAVLDAEVLLEVTFKDPLRITGRSEEAGEYPLSGIQRGDSSRRLSEIGRFIDSTEAVFPTPVILAANYRQDGIVDDDEPARWKVIDHADGRVELEIPTPTRLASIVDGQHRLLAFQRVTVEERKKMPVACSIFFDLPNPYQAYLFATVNFNQKPVSKSLALELYGFDTEDESPEAWSPDKAAVFFCRKLNTDSASPFYGRVLVAAKDARLLHADQAPTSWRVSTASVVEGILRLFSRAPRSDRATIFAKTVAEGRRRQDLADDGTPLRKLYLDTNDLAIYELLKNYFLAAKETLWDTARGDSYLYKTVGIQALFDVLQKFAGDAVRTKDISVAYFRERFRAAANLNFSDPFFQQASGKGRVRIRNAIAFAMGLEPEADLPAADLTEYKRVTGR